MIVESEHVGKSAVNSQLWTILQTDDAVMGKQKKKTLGLNHRQNTTRAYKYLYTVAVL
jgi:hypothetical protein